MPDPDLGNIIKKIPLAIKIYCILSLQNHFNFIKNNSATYQSS